MRNGRDGRFGDRTVPQIVLGRSSERAVTGGDFSRRFSGRDGAMYDPNAMMMQKKQKKREENEENGASFFGANHEDLPAANSVSGCVLTTLQNAHAGAVRGLDFNPFSSNLLA